MLTDPHGLLIETLERLEGCLQTRDLDGAVACFVPDGAIFGEDPLEQAHGTAELTLLLAEVLEHPFSVGWDVHETWVRIVGQTAWFVASASLVLRDGKQEVGREPFPMSGVLRGGAGFFRFELFNGTQPLLRPGLRLVDAVA
ncbi:hypothetical protein NPS01_23730 [Nocardioides psychrotolerans]|uniref:SnoaL-like domain-containing protein n=1 Tax=Nocardioides psychrotolerans TaxID=1005945 RepID=A0A1I3HVP9_9ACTN|nr:nuclear transport factor 2 family protein [Nocardioides psychrotolerans]GEP38710.1 hypothetical protein NPS01_23730 [Nocardioides psychrotolerans]SFI39795.1 SnoaL-like domain-containing protein [Nocardioides psychrotolerans]